MSSFGWLDTSEDDRRRALEVIESFTLRGTRDELGIGRIRDTLSDALCPALTTVQTRAAYFLFVPWIYAALDARSLRAGAVRTRGRSEELALRDALVESGEVEGVIGIQAGDTLQRLPSSVYWGGIEALGIHLSVAEAARRRMQGAADAEGERPRSTRWDPHLPRPPEDFPEGVALGLRTQDAEYLRDRFRQSAPASLVTWLLDRGDAVPEVPYAWEHPHRDAMPAELARVVAHAEAFSLQLHGAALFYNRMLAEAAGRDERIAEYGTELAAWLGRVAEHAATRPTWDRAAFWHFVYERNPRTRSATKDFCETWFQRVDTATSVEDLLADTNARALIERQERRLKRRRARLASRAHLEMWNGAAGTGRLGFRWFVARQVAQDILDGLAGGA